MKLPKYTPKLLYKNHHFNTIYTSKYRKVETPNYIRNRVILHDNDFIDVDTLKGNGDKGIFLFHGLEGSSGSQYMKSMAKTFHDKGYNVYAVNFRGCSGENNLNLDSYHSGKTDDIEFLINRFTKQDSLKSIVAIGYSLGGNALLKYAGDTSIIKPKCMSHFVCVSAPLDLSGSATEIGKWYNFMYQLMFFKTLKAKAIEKHRLFPNSFNLKNALGAKSFFQLDDSFTAPIHGFKDVHDYYKKSSALQYLKGIKFSTLILSAQDDSFISDSCRPEFSTHKNDVIKTYYPKHGGHVGFGGDKYLKKGFIEEVVLSFISNE